MGGTDFPTGQDGIFVEATLLYGEEWKLLSKNAHSLQTHTAYADDEGFYIFAHSFDMHFVAESVQGW